MHHIGFGVAIQYNSGCMIAPMLLFSAMKIEIFRSDFFQGSQIIISIFALLTSYILNGRAIGYPGPDSHIPVIFDRLAAQQPLTYVTAFETIIFHIK